MNGEIKARLLVGAGHFCPISRFMGNGNHEEAVVAQEIEFEMTTGQATLCTIQPEIPDSIFVLTCWAMDNLVKDFLNVR